MVADVSVVWQRVEAEEIACLVADRGEGGLEILRSGTKLLDGHKEQVKASEP